MPYQLFQHRTYRIADCVVIDGDTIHAEVAEEFQPRQQHRIRLHGIDAPELAQPYGPESAQYLLNLLRNDPVYAYITQDSDAYDRAVAILHRGNRHDSLNARLVRAGLAYAYYSADYQAAEHSARAARAGVWQQSNGGERPWDYRKHSRTKPPGGGCFSSISIALLLAGLLALLIIALIAA